MLAIIQGRLDGKRFQKCPYCLSEDLKIHDYRSCRNRERKYGTTIFFKKCKSCNQKVFHISSDETLERRRQRYQDEIVSGKVVE